MTTDTDKPQAPMNAREALERVGEIADNAIRTRSRDTGDWIDDMQRIRDTALAASLPQGEAGVPKMALIPVEPQPTYIEPSGRWMWPLPKQAQFPGCCTEVVTASREWWEYAPSEAKPHPMAEALQLRNGEWYWVVLSAVSAAPNRTICICGVSFTVGDTEMIAFHKDCHKARFIHRSPAAPKEKP